MNFVSGVTTNFVLLSAVSVKRLNHLQQTVNQFSLSLSNYSGLETGTSFSGQEEVYQTESFPVAAKQKKWQGTSHKQCHVKSAGSQGLFCALFALFLN